MTQQSLSFFFFLRASPSTSLLSALSPFLRVILNLSCVRRFLLSSWFSAFLVSSFFSTAGQAEGHLRLLHASRRSLISHFASAAERARLVWTLGLMMRELPANGTCRFTCVDDKGVDDERRRKIFVTSRPSKTREGTIGKPGRATRDFKGQLNV